MRWISKLPKIKTPQAAEAQLELIMFGWGSVFVAYFYFIFFSEGNRFVLSSRDYTLCPQVGLNHDRAMTFSFLLEVV